MAEFDLNKVLNIVDNDKNMARTLLQMTLDLGTTDLDEMKNLTGAGEFQSAGKLAHKLKSSLATLGFLSISELMKDLEAYAKTNVDSNVFKEKVDIIDSKVNELFDFIRHSLETELK